MPQSANFTSMAKNKAQRILNVSLLFLILLVTVLLLNLETCSRRYSSSEDATSLPELTGRIVDRAQVFSLEDKARLEEAVQALETSTGGQMAVLTLPELRGWSIEEFCIRLAEKWQIGHKGSDNGALLLFSLRDRQLRLEIGYGWEGEINDARAGDIIRAMGAYFRNQDFAGGTLYAIRKVESLVTGHEAAASGEAEAYSQADSEADSQLTKSDILFLLFFFGIAGTILIMALFGRGRGSGFGGGGFGGFGGGGFSGGGGRGFSGGGGSFGGGGASGRW